MLTFDSQQLFKFGKSIITKGTKGKPQSGPMLMFSYIGTLSIINKLLVSLSDFETN